MSDQHQRTRTPTGAIPDCYACGGTGTIAGFGRTGERCPCIDAPDEP